MFYIMRIFFDMWRLLLRQWKAANYENLQVHCTDLDHLPRGRCISDVIACPFHSAVHTRSVVYHGAVVGITGGCRGQEGGEYERHDNEHLHW
jgi:hypothetical protein